MKIIGKIPKRKKKFVDPCVYLGEPAFTCYGIRNNILNLT